MDLLSHLSIQEGTAGSVGWWTSHGNCWPSSSLGVLLLYMGRGKALAETVGKELFVQSPCMSQGAYSGLVSAMIFGAE